MSPQSFPGNLSTQVNLTPLDPIGNSSEVVGILGMGFRQEVVGCRKISESQDFDRIPDQSGTFRHPTTSGRSPIPRIPTTFDEFLSGPIKSDNFSDRIRSDTPIGLLVLSNN